jgi:hypothetical protein
MGTCIKLRVHMSYEASLCYRRRIFTTNKKDDLKLDVTHEIFKATVLSCCNGPPKKRSHLQKIKYGQYIKVRNGIRTREIA